MLHDPDVADSHRLIEHDRSFDPQAEEAEPDALELIASGLRQAADTVSRLQRSLETCLDRAERARAGSNGGGTVHLVGRAPAEANGSGGDRTLVASMEVHGFLVEPGRHTVEVEGRRVLLTPNEWQLFALMLAHPGQTLSRDELAVGAWGVGFGGRDSEVEVYISRLRRKLESDPRSPLIIETVRGAGYRLVPPEEPEIRDGGAAAPSRG